MVSQRQWELLQQLEAENINGTQVILDAITAKVGFLPSEPEGNADFAYHARLISGHGLTAIVMRMGPHPGVAIMSPSLCRSGRWRRQTRHQNKPGTGTRAVMTQQAPQSAARGGLRTGGPMLTRMLMRTKTWQQPCPSGPLRSPCQMASCWEEPRQGQPTRRRYVHALSRMGLAQYAPCCLAMMLVGRVLNDVGAGKAL